MSDKKTTQDEIKLGRVGHFAHNYGRSEMTCWEARVVKVWGPTLINLAGSDDNGNAYSRSSIPVETDQNLMPDMGSFHLNRDCPWER